MKSCFKCGEAKPLSEFHKHKGMKDGLLGKCKECTKMDSKSRRENNLDSVRKYDRSRAKLPHRKARKEEHNKKWKTAERAAAHNAVSRAIRSGKLTRLPYVVCGSENSVAHHEDYSKKLDVIWFCQAHHVQHHVNLRSK